MTDNFVLNFCNSAKISFLCLTSIYKCYVDALHNVHFKIVVFVVQTKANQLHDGISNKRNTIPIHSHIPQYIVSYRTIVNKLTDFGVAKCEGKIVEHSFNYFGQRKPTDQTEINGEHNFVGSNLKIRRIELSIANKIVVRENVRTKGDDIGILMLCA